jgi:hypothetical protein
VATKDLGVVECKKCHKPYIYALSTVYRMKPPLPPSNPDNTSPSWAFTSQHVKDYQSMAKAKLHDASESQIFMFDMAPLDPDDPCYDLFQSDPSLDCDTHMEA